MCVCMYVHAICLPVLKPVAYDLIYAFLQIELPSRIYEIKGGDCIYWLRLLYYYSYCTHTSPVPEVVGNSESGLTN